MARWPLVALVLSALQPYLTPNGKLAARNLSLLTLFSALTQLCGLLTLLVLTRSLAPWQFGALVSALVLQSYLVLIGSLGIRTIVVREGSRKPEGLDTLMTSHFAITAVGSILTCIAVSVLVLSSPASPEEAWLLLIVAAANIAASVNIQPLFDVHHRQGLSGALSLLPEVLALLFLCLVSRTHRLTLPLVGMVFAAKWLLITLLHYGVYHLAIRPLKFLPDARQALSLVRVAWPLLLTSLTATVPITTGVILLRLIRGPAEAAVLAIPTQVCQGYLVLAGLAFRVLQPHIAGVYGTTASFIRKLVVFAVVFLSGLLAAVWACFFVLLRYVFPGEYRSSLGPLAMMLVSAAIVGGSYLCWAYLVTLHRELAVFKAYALAALLFLACGPYMMHHWSYLGAASLSVVSSLACLVLMLKSVIGSLRVTRSQGAIVGLSGHGPGPG